MYYNKHSGQSGRQTLTSHVSIITIPLSFHLTGDVVVVAKTSGLCL